MLRIKITALLSLLSVSIFCQVGDLTVVVTDIESEEGFVQVGLYNDSETFPDTGGEYKIKRKPVEGDQVIITFKNLKEGEYAFGAYHDKNEDGECNLSLVGVPIEGFCFSRNYEPTINEPGFEDCKFKVNGDVKLTVEMIN